MNIVRSLCYAQILATSQHMPRRIAVAALGSLLFAAAGDGVAQRESSGGPNPQDNRSSAMGTKPDPATSAVHESNAPQAKEAKGGKRGPTAGQNSKPDGAGGFGNGLYGTGAGSNK
ncbi:MAG TPA: beta-xylosidase [Paraburkholderia sp.]|jgi:hypothetical protein|nr:beta-xylosidase [Paraburkholderia sp.]